jgi:type IX secretion system PorP/SprF family membrane protein
MPAIKKTLTLLFLSAFMTGASAQESTFNPVPFWIYTPYIYNPAMVGTKDYLTVDMNALFKDKINTQILGGNARFSKTGTGYSSSPDIMEFRNTGFGASLYHGVSGPSRNIGINAAASYQIPLSLRKLSYLSFGLSGKGVYNMYDSIAAETGGSVGKTFHPNFDAGLYFYTPSFYTGLSAANIINDPEMPDSLGIYGIPAARQYFFTAGFKILISKSLNIVLEPSIITSVNDSTISEAYNYIKPVVKLYVENFCIGSYFLNEGNVAFFFQYRFPSLYVGAFFEVPKKSPYYKTEPIIEFTIGLNLRKDKSRLSKSSRW